MQLTKHGISIGGEKAALATNMHSLATPVDFWSAIPIDEHVPEQFMLHVAKII